jgi:FKBP-type peptidyl-prolyl cis-trans isomerase
MRSLASLYALPLALLLPIVAAASTLGIEVTQAQDCTRKTQNGDKITVNYRGTLESDGSQFDSSYDRGTPFQFTLGKGQVISGWDQGLLGMCIGEGRKLTIPPSMGYGAYGAGSIPGGATLSMSTWLERAISCVHQSSNVV